MNFFKKLENNILKKDSLLCVGLDPQGENIKSGDIYDNLVDFGKRIVEQTNTYAACFKPNIAFYESFGLVPVEALACGTPVVVSQIAEMKNIVQEGKNGFSFRPNDPASLSRVLEYFFSNQHSLWEKEKIRQHIIERFSWENTAEETYSFFKKILKERSSLTTISQPGESLQLV